MTETIIIRLGSQYQDKVHWLIWAEQNQEIIASGELDGAQALNAIADKTMQRKVVVLVPGCDVAIKSLQVPSKSAKAMKLAAPYMLEDELAQDVDQLFFAYGSDKFAESDKNCFLAAVERTQMQAWLFWLTEANIKPKQMLPDVLALPYFEDGAAIALLDQQAIVRTGSWQGMVIDQSFWQQALAQLADQSTQEGNYRLYSYSSLPALPETLAVEQMPEELPLAVFASQLAKVPFNLLQDEFQIKEQRSPIFTHWSRVAMVAGVALLINFAIKGAQIIQLNHQQQVVEQQIIDVYKQAFPQTKRVRINTIRSQLNRKMQELGSDNPEHGFLPLLAKLQPAFVKVAGLKPESIKFDAARQELRMQASAKDYQSFDRFKTELEAMQLVVAQGAQRNQGDMVSGSLSITAKGAR